MMPLPKDVNYALQNLAFLLHNAMNLVFYIDTDLKLINTKNQILLDLSTTLIAKLATANSVDQLLTIINQWQNNEYKALKKVIKDLPVKKRNEITSSIDECIQKYKSDLNEYKAQEKSANVKAVSPQPQSQPQRPQAVSHRPPEKGKAVTEKKSVEIGQHRKTPPKV